MGNEVTIDSLKIQLETDAGKASNGLEALEATLNKIKNATKGGVGLTAVARQLGKVNTEISGINSSSVGKLTGLAKAIDSLSKVKLSTTIAGQLGKINEILPKLDIGDGATKITELVSALKPLEELGKSSLGTTVNALKKLPEAMEKLDTKKLYGQVQSLTRIMRPLAVEMEKIAQGFSAFPSRIQKLIKENEKLSASTAKVANHNKTASTSFVDLYAKLKMATSAVKNVANKIASFIKLSNDYVENVNLFTVAMGEYADAASKYADQVASIMGIDPGEWMRTQGIFMTLATGFGVASDRAYTMSKNLTQLGYDLSSFFNIGTEDAMQKLQSGISGELEPLRRLGFDLSQAKLEATALSLGIDKAVSSMTQAEKAQLRYYAIMTQVTTAQGDMARTLDAPANQLRILKAQVDQAGRAIGNIFIPALNAVLPYVIATFQVIRKLANAIADLFGYSMPEIDYSGVASMGSSADDATDSIDGTTDAVKKLQKYTMGFDELNIIDPNSGSSDALDSLGDLNFDLPEYDFIGGAVQEKVDGIVEKMEGLLLTVGLIGGAIGAWKIGSSLLSNVDALKTKLSNLKQVAGITLMIAGVALEFDGAYDMGKDGADAKNILETAIGGALGLAGALLTLGTGPLGWLVGVSMTLGVGIIGFSLGYSKRKIEEDLSSRFGQLQLDIEEVMEIAEHLTTNELSIALDLYVSQETAVANAKADVEACLKTLQTYNFKIGMGLDVSQADYQTAVDNLVQSVQQYITEKHISANMAISILLDGTTAGESLTAFANTFYSEHSATLSSLGSQLKQVVAEGFRDGEWIPEKLQEAMKLQEEIQSVYNEVENLEYRAKLKTIGLDITPESLTQAISEANEVVQGQLKNLEKARLSAYMTAELQLDTNLASGMAESEAYDIYNEMTTAINNQFSLGKLELSNDFFTKFMELLNGAYGDEVTKMSPFFEQSTDELIANGLLKPFGELNYENVPVLTSQLYDMYAGAFNGLDISKEASATAKKYVSMLTPTAEMFEEYKEDLISRGESVPEWINEGLNKYEALEAIANSADGISNLIARHLSTDTKFLEMLTTVEGAGKSIGTEISDGILGNLQIIEDASAGTITLINDTIGEKVLEVTPTLVKNFEDMGYDLSAGVYDGVESHLESKDGKWAELFGKIGTKFREIFKINSPSKVFAENGGYLMEGLFDGADAGLSEEAFGKIFGRISTAMTETMPDIKKGANGILSYFETMSNGIIKGVNGAIKALNNLKIDIPDWMKSLTGIDSFRFNIPMLKEISIPRLATGGMVESGQMFIAREAGAELVGTIGRKTAVVNNEQIIEGIASGVSVANSESNALLREQNALLRGILEKETGVYLDGKHLSDSVDKYKRERGRVLVTGGAY